MSAPLKRVRYSYDMALFNNLKRLVAAVAAGEVALQEPVEEVEQHSHPSFVQYNSERRNICEKNLQYTTYTSKEHSTEHIVVAARPAIS